jgi:FkbM family methyltransferase
MFKFFRTKRNRARSAEQLRRKFFILQSELKPDIFVEAGAYDGITSIEMRDVLPDATIVAFEAHPTNFEHFSSLLDHRSARVCYLNCALAECDREVTFHVLKNGGINKKSSIKQRNEARNTVPVTVAARSLDSYLANIPGVCSLWVDVEGATREVLSGAKDTLKRTVSALIEVEEREYWKDQWLATDVIKFMDGFGLCPVARDYEYPHQYNVLFLKK